METAKKQIGKQHDVTRSRIEAVLRSPGANDPVYQVALRLFRNESPLNLNRTNDARYRIRRLAWKRFILGYPPRKSGDTTTGDAINWEWMICCAATYAKDLVIVSRDSDYGPAYQSTPIVNDWLVQEFRERVGKRRKIVLTDKLSEGFGHLSVRVTKQEVDDEASLLDSVSQVHADPARVELAKALIAQLSERDGALFGHFLGLHDGRPHSFADIESRFGLPAGSARTELGRITQHLQATTQRPKT